MRRFKSFALMAFLPLLGLSFQCSEVLANQKMNQILRYKDMDRALSPREITLHEFLMERENLIRNREDENPRILKNKLKILNSKIEFLQREIRRVKPHVIRQRLVASDPTLVPPPAQEPELVSVEPKLILSSAPRGHAEMRTVETEFRMMPDPASREEAVELPSPSLPPVVVKSKPVSDGKWPSTGADWKAMAHGDKEIYILSLMGNLSRRDVYLMKPYSFYIQSIDRAIERDPKLEQELVHRILMTAAYDSEPDSRKDLEKVW